MCDWVDESTLIAFLQMGTAASPGMRVGIRPNVLWPQGLAGNCSVSESMCAAAQSVYVDTDFPCDVATTNERELCMAPTALVQAPAVISSCPGTSVDLDGSRSSGAAARPLYR